MLKVPGKIIFIVFLSIVFLFSCAKNSEGESLVVAIDFPSYDAARAIMGEEGLRMLLPAGAECHDYEPTPKDMIALSDASLVIYTGGESEAWVDKIVASLDKDVEVFKLIDQVSIVMEEKKDGMTLFEDEDELDEHVWTSPVNEARIVANLEVKLEEIFPDRKDDLKANAEGYVEKLGILDKEIRSVVKSAKHNTLVFASRFPFRYFTDEYGLDYFAAFPGCAEETEPSAKTVAFLIDKVKDLGLRYIIDIEFGSPLIASAIAQEAGVGIISMHSMHDVSSSEMEAKEDYISIMTRNIEALKEALN